MQGLGLLVILFFFGIAGGVVGRLKGSSFFIWFLISFCVPFIGLLTAVFYRYDSEELRRQCPHCGKVVKLHDAVCAQLRDRARVSRRRDRLGGRTARQAPRERLKTPPA